MGGNSSKHNKQQVHDPTEGAELFDETETCKFYRDPSSGIEYEKYLVDNDGSRDFDNSYIVRAKNIQPELVELHYASTFEVIQGLRKMLLDAHLLKNTKQ